MSTSVEAPQHLTFSGAPQVGVQSNHIRVLDAVRAMFPEVATSCAGPALHEPLIVEWDGDSTYVMHGITSADDAAWPSQERRAKGVGWSPLVEHLEHVLANRLLAAHSEALHLHAGGVCLDGAGVLLLGASGAGKSTVSTRLLLDGAPLLGDDVVLLRPNGVAEPFRRRPKLDVDQARRFGIEPESTVLWHADADECWLDPGLWAGWSRAVPVRIVVRIAFAPAAGLTVMPMTPAEVLAELVGSLFPSEPDETGRRIDGLVDLAARCTGLSINYTNAADAARVIRQTADALADARLRSDL